MTSRPPITRLVVDGSRCDGHGICALVCPERISLDQWGYATIDDEPIEDSRTLARARRAVEACPADALMFRESREPPVRPASAARPESAR